MRCGRAQKLLTAAVDGELSPGRRTALDRHLAGCPVCRTELTTTDRMLRALEALPIAAPVPDALEQATLRRVRVLAAEEGDRAATSGWRTWLPLPALALTAVLVLAIAITRTSDDRGSTPVVPAPERVARARPARPNLRAVAVAPPSEPPPALAAAPELFVDLPMLRKLDRVKHFEAIQTTTLDDETPSGEEAPSNG